MNEHYIKYRKNILDYQKSEKGKIAHKQAQDKYDRTQNGKTSNRKRTMQYNKNNTDKIEAQSKLNSLFYKHNISNADFICAICGKQPIEKHHENYNLWYSFIPLCKQCHCGTYMRR